MWEWQSHTQVHFAFAVGSFFAKFVVCNPFSKASFTSVTSSRARHSPVDGNERLDTCEFITLLVDVDAVNYLEGEWDFPPHQLFAFAVGSFLAIFVYQPRSSIRPWERRLLPMPRMSCAPSRRGMSKNG
jgi:hypothetical protein